MAFCSQCGAEIPDGATSCPNCNATVAQPKAVVANEWDHTAEFDAKDISDNKIYALSAYLLSFFGIIMCLLVKDSPYAKFHAREALKIDMALAIISVITSLLCWTCIVPIVGIVFICILVVVDIIAMVQVCKGEAKEPWLIRSFKGFH